MRLRTLPLSLAGVILGVMLAADNTVVSPWTAGLILLTTVSLQILSNLSNELGDTLKGTDSADRQGPRYAIGSGDMSVEDIRILIGLFIAFCIVFGLAMIRVSFGSIFKTVLPAGYLHGIFQEHGMYMKKISSKHSAQCCHI